MSSSSSSPSSAAASPPQWKPDVFISFRGKDTRKNFMSHLFYRLSNAGIGCYRDDNERDVGKTIEVKLSEAIDQVRFALIMFSEHYANSRWCMNELVDILDRQKDHEKPSLKVIPIFYGMRPADVSKWGENGEFDEALSSYPEDKKKGMKKKWRGALEEVKKVTGYDLNEHAHSNESTLIDIIVEQLIEGIRKIRPLYFVKDATGVDDSAKDVISLLKKGDKKVARWVGICGPEGIGKTTVAGVAFNAIRDEYDCSVFIAKIGEARKSDRVDMQNKLLEELGRQGRCDVIGTNSNEIKQRMRDKRVLLVLDGVTDEKQVDDFGSGKPSDNEPLEIGHGSRILIITRERALLHKLQVDDVYIVKGLSQDVACRLFRRHALKTTEQDVEELSKCLVHYAGGHPLLLKRLGSYVSDGWTTHWRKTLDKLVRSASSLSLPSPSVGLFGGQGRGAHHGASPTDVSQFTVRVESTSNSDSITIDCTRDGRLRFSKHSQYPDGENFPVKLDYANGYRTPFDSLGAGFGPSPRTYPFEFVGPFGIVDGEVPQKNEEWTDVREIVVYVDDDSEPKAIKGVTIIYDECGRPSDPVSHGTKEGRRYSVELDYPSEYLTTISGYIKEDSECPNVRSLTFHTNVNERTKTFGEFGGGGGKEFSFPYTGGKIIGFYMSFNDSQSHLKSIGAFYQQVPHTYPIRYFGPFGGDDEKSWDFVNIDGIDVRYDADFIKCIDFSVDVATSTEPVTSYGQNGGENTYKVKLGNGEYITSFAGYFDNANGRGTRINSLTFQTSKRIWGPIGSEKGEPFSLPLESGKVVGFFGTSGDFLESIGARVKLLEHSEKLYPFQLVGLLEREDKQEREDKYTSINVKKIIVEVVDPSGEQRFIRSIEFQSEDKEKKPLRLKTCGSIDENESLEGKEYKFEMDSEEYLISMSGYTSDSDNARRMTSLTFQTNKRTSRPFGIEKGRYFSSPAVGKIAGFYSRRSQRFRHLIGAQLEPILKLYPIKSIGPFGRRGKRDWNDDKHIAVRKIRVMIDDDDGHRISFCYHQRDEEQVWSEEYRFGTDEPHNQAANVILQYPWEYLTSISGVISVDEQNDNAIIQSLTFHSNKTSYGPYGKKNAKGQYFWYPSTRSRIIGFHGTCDDGTLTSIGVYAEPIPKFYPFRKVGPFGRSSGTPWDDGVHTDVRGFYICHGSEISSIRIDYDNNGSFVFGSEHGVAHQKNLKEEVILDFPKERLLSVRGAVRQNENANDTTIHDLWIFTTKPRQYGPFASTANQQNDRKKLEKFIIPSESSEGRIVGFFGSAGTHLNSIGARLESC